MTNLEKQIFLAIGEHPFHTNIDKARIAAKIALELAYDAYNQGVLDSGVYEHGGGNRTFKQFIQDYE